jgi:hypothetical protein
MDAAQVGLSALACVVMYLAHILCWYLGCQIAIVTKFFMVMSSVCEFSG